MAVNDLIMDKVIGQTVNLQRYAANTRVKVRANLQLLRDDLRKQIERLGLDTKALTSVKYQRLSALLSQTNATIKTRMSKAAALLESDLRDVVPVVANGAVGAINYGLQTKVASVQLTPALMRKLTRDNVVHGGAATEWWGKQEATLRAGFAQQVRLGIMSGETTGDIVKRVIGGHTGTQVVTIGGKTRKIPTYAGGIMDATQRDAESLVITATNSVMNATREEVYSQNKDVLKGQGLIVTLDNRTTPICRARSGGAWSFTGDPLPESSVQIQFPGPPPYHFRCRSTLIPLTKAWAELANDAGADSAMVDKLKAVNEKEGWLQSSMNGQVPADLTYGNWLKSKSVAVQKDILGPVKHDLWVQDKLTFPEMVDTTGQPLTLPELEERVAIKEEAMIAPVSIDGPEIGGIWTKDGPRLGSNPGGSYLDDNNVKWYVKEAIDSDHAANEHLASELYKAAGVDTPDVKRVTLNGKPAVASRWRTDALFNKPTSEVIAEAELFQDGFATDAWLANWDVVGLNIDNILLTNKGTALRVDTGGSLLFRAQGSPKGSAFGDLVNELDLLRNKAKNPQAAQIFGSITDEGLVKSIDRVMAIDKPTIEKLVLQYGPGTLAEREDLVMRLVMRRADIGEYRAMLVERISEAAAKKASEEAAAKIIAAGKQAKLAKDAAYAKSVKDAVEQAAKDAKAAAKAGLPPPTPMPRMPTLDPSMPDPTSGGPAATWKEWKSKVFAPFEDEITTKTFRWHWYRAVTLDEQRVVLAKWGLEPTEDRWLFKVKDAKLGEVQFVRFDVNNDIPGVQADLLVESAKAHSKLTEQQKDSLEGFTGASYREFRRLDAAVGLKDDAVKHLYEGWLQHPKIDATTTTWRGMSGLDERSFLNFQQDDIVTWPSFSSHSLVNATGDRFMDIASEDAGGRVMFKVSKSKTGRFIAGSSKVKHENEVAYGKGTRFRVIKRHIEQRVAQSGRTTPRSYLVVEMEEI